MYKRQISERAKIYFQIDSEQWISYMFVSLYTVSSCDIRP